MADNNEADSIKKIFQKMLLNTQDTKKKPYDIKINNNRNKPKIKGDIRYNAKQNYRRYKTKVEPNLRSKIQIDEKDDIVSIINKEFEKQKMDKKNPEITTAEAPYMKPPDDAKDPETKFGSSRRNQQDGQDGGQDRGQDGGQGDDYFDFVDRIQQAENQTPNQKPAESLNQGTLDLSEISDIDREVITEIENKIQAFTPEVMIRGVDVSQVEDIRSLINKELKKSHQARLLVDEEFTKSQIRARVRRALQQKDYIQTLSKKRDVSQKMLSAFGEASEASEASEATTLFQTPSGEASMRRRGRPLGSVNKISSKLEGTTLDLTQT